MFSIVILGADTLALRVCEELCATYECRVTVLWRGDGELARSVEALGANYLVRSRPEEAESLRDAGIHEANVVMLLSTDDHCNVQAALRARDMNPAIRIVLRQYNRQLGRKIEQNLPNCSVLSRSTYAAATYAAAAVDPHCIYALEFPDVNGVLTAFSRLHAEDIGLVDASPREAERRLQGRVIPGDEGELIVFRPVRPERKRQPRPMQPPFWASVGSILRRMRRLLIHVDPVARALVAAAIASVFCASAYFARRLGLDALHAAYFVVTTMTTTGYGDITPPKNDPTALMIAMLLMIAGVMFSGAFVAVVATRLTRAQWISMHGLRRIRRRGHFVICGAGSVGSRVIDFLLQLDQRVVVIEVTPSPTIVERSRDRHFDLLTGDATEDGTLELCNLEHARGLIALTESDTLNLEAALGARAHNASLPIVMRVVEGGLAASISRHFGLDRTFGSAALAAPAFAGLAFHPGARGCISISGTRYTIFESNGAELSEHASHDSIPICVWRDGAFSPLRAFADAQAEDRVLFLCPIRPKERSPSFP